MAFGHREPRENRDTVKEFEERIIQINRVSKKTQGGNTIHFSAIVALGDKKGSFGFGQGKARDVSQAITKASKAAKANMLKIKMNNGTITHEVRYKEGSAVVLLKPAKEGSGIIAGGVIRHAMELAGVKDVTAKMFGSSNKLLNLTATAEALKRLR